LLGTLDPNVFLWGVIIKMFIIIRWLIIEFRF
jgi:hypothetical protein